MKSLPPGLGGASGWLMRVLVGHSSPGGVQIVIYNPSCPFQATRVARTQLLLGCQPVRRRVLVTGASGTVGGEVVRALAAQPKRFETIAAARSALDALPDGVDTQRFEFGDRRSMVSALRGVDAVFFMTPLIEKQVALSRSFVDVALGAGVRQFVRLSSRSAGWDYESDLRAWHREVDADVAARAPLYTVLRPCSFMQNFVTHQGAAIRDKGRVALAIGDAKLPYIDARDIADVAVAALLDPAAHQAHTHVLTGGEAIDMQRVVLALGEARGAPLRYFDVEPERFADGMRASGMPTWLVDSALRVHLRTRSGLEASVTDDVQRVLGRPPRSIEDYARDHAVLLRAAS